MTGIKSVFSKNLKRIRHELNLTQEKFAEKVDIQPRSLTDFENAKYLPKVETIDKICEKLNIPVGILFQLPIDEAEDEKSERIRLINEKLAVMDIEKINVFYNILLYAFNK